MPQPSDPKGFPETLEAMYRIANRGNVRLSPGQMRHAATRLYFPPNTAMDAERQRFSDQNTSDLPADSPWLNRDHWINLARLGDPEAEQPTDPVLPEGGSNDEWRERMRKTDLGPGWTQGDLRRLGREREAHELSPGDVQRQQWIRDREFLESMANRDADTDNNWTGGWPWQKSQIDNALHYYHKARNNWRHAYGSGPEDLWATSNTQRRAGLQGMAEALQNPDFAVGQIGHVSSAPGNFLSKMATMDPGAQDPPSIAALRKASGTAFDPLGAGTAIAAGYDIFRNIGKSLLADALTQDSEQPTSELAGHVLDSYRNSVNQAGRQVSPVLSGLEDGSAEEREAVKQQQLSDLDETLGMPFDDYYRAKTGEAPSYFGSTMASALSDAPVDPLTILTGPLGGLLRYGNEVIEEALTSIPLAFGMMHGLGHSPPLSQWFASGTQNRPDYLNANMSAEDFQDYISNYDHNLRSALLRQDQRASGKFRPQLNRGPTEQEREYDAWRSRRAAK